MIWFGWLLCHWSSFPTVQFSYNSWTTHFLSVATGLEFDIDFSNFTELLFARFQRLLRSADVHCRHLLLDLRRRSLFQGKENLCHFLFRVCCVVCSLCVNWKFLARPIQPQRISKNLKESRTISKNLEQSQWIRKNSKEPPPLIISHWLFRWKCRKHSKNSNYWAGYWSIINSGAERTRSSVQRIWKILNPCCSHPIVITNLISLPKQFSNYSRESHKIKCQFLVCCWLWNWWLTRVVFFCSVPSSPLPLIRRYLSGAWRILEWWRLHHHATDKQIVRIHLGVTFLFVFVRFNILDSFCQPR